MTLDEKLQACVKGCRLSDETYPYPFGLAFRAGAAAMAELFASGQGLRVEHADPRQVHIYHSPDCPVSQPNFRVDLSKGDQCTCDFSKRLKHYLETGVES